MAEGIVGVMQWRNHPRGAFPLCDVQLAAEWATVASPMLQLVATNAERVALEERVNVANQKRDALLATAKILGSTRSIEQLFTEVAH